ncbi:MAG TPA: sugar ABC transporter permease [Chloroflexota bacterium]|nr:sugar ABC transporter permease [Chloroflexota bacterium]
MIGARRAARAGSRGGLRRREAIEGFLLVSPWGLGLLLFIVGPLLASAYLSLAEYSVLRPPRFVGLDNYAKALFEDPIFWQAIQRTSLYVVMLVPLGLAASLGCALLLNRGVRGTNLFRTLFFLPTLTPIVAGAILWTWIFQPEVGLLNYALRAVGIQGPRWLSSYEWALPSLVIIGLWGSVGGSRMIIFLAGLQGVPQELFDAAAIDGANNWQKFRNVTLPMISPTMLFNLVLGIIAAFKVFAVSYVATGGGPAYSTWFFVYHIYNQAFKYSQMGYASALAWIFCVVILAFTFLQFRLSNRWVHYEGEREDRL